MMPEKLPYKEQVKHFNAMMSQILNVAPPPPLQLEELEIKLLSCHYSIQAPGLKIEEHEHPNYELTFMETGEMTTFCENSQIICSAGNGTILFIPPATLHHRIFGKHTTNINMSFVFTISGHHSHARALCSAMAKLTARQSYQMKMSPQLKSLYAEIKRQAVSEMPLAETIAKNLLYAFCSMFFQQNFAELFASTDKSIMLEQFNFETDRIEAIKRTLVFLIKEKNAMRIIQNYFGMSARHLNRIFKAATGMTINQYHNEMKLTHARNLLSSSSVPISEIAYSLGFVSPVRFSCFFKKHQCCSPSHYRKNRKYDKNWQ
jgi:AraC-like DNA-binding protein